MSFSEFVAALDGGAREHSQAQPWQQHLADMRGPVDIPIVRPTGGAGMPSMPGGGGGGMPSMPSLGGGSQISAAELERLLDPRVTEGLQLSRSQHQSAQELMRALGLEHDEGEPAGGFLNAAFRVVDYPRALTFNAFRALLDPSFGFQEFREGLDRREDDPSRRQGFGDLGPLVMDESDSNLTRFWKGAAALAGDLITDPLMYISLGAIPAGKKLGSQAVQKAVAKRALDLPEEVLKRAQQDALAANARAGAQALGRDLSEDAVERATRQLEGMAPEQLMGHMAAEAYQLRGATGLREILTKYGDDSRKLWESLPSDMRGGLRLRVPFRREEQVRKTISIAGGGGQLAQALGLGPLVSQSHQLRNAVRASQMGKAVSSKINGTYGDLYGEVIARLVERGGNNVSGTTWAIWQHADEARRGAMKVKKAFQDAGQKTAARVTYTLDTAGSEKDVKEAWAAFNRYGSNPEELDRLARTVGIEGDDLGRQFINMGEDALEVSKNELLGLGAAAEYHHLLRSMHAQAVDAGVDIGYLNDYLPLLLTEQKAAELGARKAGLGKRAGRMSRGEDPSRTRVEGFELRAVTDEDGVVRTVMHPLTPKQANQRARERAEAMGEKVDTAAFFEEDLGVMLDRYSAALGHMTSEAKFSQLIRKSGLLAEGDAEYVAKLRTKPAGEGQQSIERALDLLRQIDSGDTGPQLRQAIHAILDDSDALQKTIHRAVNDGSLTDGQRVELAGDVLKTMDTWLHRLPSAGEANKVLAKARREFEKARGQLREASRDEKITGPGGRALTELGMTPVAREEGLRKLPPELDMAFAPEALTSAIHKFYELKGPKAQGIIDRWYRPYHAMFKMTATIGRGPGFHIRNAWGGTINNMLYGATPEDAWTMSRIVNRMVKAGRQARRDVAGEVPKESREAGSVRVTRGFEERVQERTEEILQKTLRDIQITDDMDGYQFYRAMVDQEDILWGRQHGRGFEAFGLEDASEAMGGRVGMRRSARYPGRDYDELSAAQKGVEKLQNFWWIRMNASAAEMTEAYLRGTAFLHGMRKYRDPEVARLGTLTTQFDYQDLSEFERRVLRGSLLPFYTWTRNNIPFQFRALFQNPGRANALNRLVANAENAFGDDDADLLPEWMASRFGFVSRFTFGGNPLMLGAEHPAQDLNEYFKVGSLGSSMEGMARGLGSALNPALSVPMQIGWGTEFFTGATLSETDQRLAPRWYQAMAQANLVPQWVDPKTGDVMGDARWIVGAPGAIPWLGQGEKLLSIAGIGGPEGTAAYPEGRDRRMSDAIRQFFPVVTAGTLTPQGESGELFQRTRRLRSQAARRGDPEDYAMVVRLQEAGYSLEEIAHIMEARRARREAG